MSFFNCFFSVEVEALVSSIKSRNKSQRLKITYSFGPLPLSSNCSSKCIRQRRALFHYS